MKRTLSLLIVLLVLTAVFQTTFAQSGGGFDLSWSAVDGGGGRSSDGVYELTGTAGQIDAGFATGSGYELSSGFWQTQPQDPTAVMLHNISVNTPNPTWIFPIWLLLAFTLTLLWLRQIKK